MKERLKNVELCPESAAMARQQISANGQQIVGWYHSHPFFKVEPSNIDIRNHANYQSSFDKDNLPFVALITGPYSDKSKLESLVKVFHNKRGHPFTLKYKQMPASKIRKAIFEEISGLFTKYKGHEDNIDLMESWLPEVTRHEKLIRCINYLLDKNLRANESFEVEEFLKDIDRDSLHERDTSLQTLKDDSEERESSKVAAKVSYINVKQAKKIVKIMHKIEKKLKVTFGIAGGESPEKQEEDAEAGEEEPDNNKASSNSTKSKSIVITL